MRGAKDRTAADDDMATDRLLTRRQALARLGASGAALLATRRAAAATESPLPACVVRPRQTEGPFFVDRDLERTDLRLDPNTGAVKPGTPLRLAFRVSRVGASACAPLAGAQVHVWHCDADGHYSSLRERRLPNAGEAFLRGFQRTDATGAARFMTIYPGWYPGRAVHLHFKIRTADAARGAEFTSQLYFDDALSERVYAAPPYAARGRPELANADDFLFRDGGRQLLLDVTRQSEGYAAVFDIGLQA
jgi:protocatechuate 3,4-dioxygenase beta subunit